MTSGKLVSKKLPRPTHGGTVTVEEAIGKRRTAREYSEEPLTIEALSQLLWAAQGITGESGKRATPSAGAQYPLRMYVAAGSVLDLPVGLYEYNVERHSLNPVSGGDLRNSLYNAALDDQPWVREAAALIAVMADWRLEEHFKAQPPRGERGARYAYIETGALAQNLHLQAAALGLGAILVGGFDDDRVKAAIRAPPEFGPTALLCIGFPHRDLHPAEAA